MKKMVTVKELKEYCERHKPQQIMFRSENQNWYRVSDPYKINLSFAIMLIYENPNLICLKSGDNTLSFDRVKRVEIDTGLSVLGTVFTVFCGNGTAEGHEFTYTLIAS